jgi:multidrug efflux pump subunit AcrA (membrane-fusion protein)
MIAMGGAGFGIGTRLTSPQEAAADAKAPEPSPVTAAVTRTTLSSTITTRGTIRFSDPKPVVLAGPVGSSSASGASAVVTNTVARGATLNEGDVAMTVAGRPVFILTGNIPMFRQIGAADTGDDVRQLEEALARLGFDPGPIDGVADAPFRAAIEAMYAAKGFKAQGLTDAQQLEQRQREVAVRTAERDLSSARIALTTAGKPPTAIEYTRADAAVQSAADGVNAARRRADNDLANANADVAARQRALAAANADVAARQRAVTEAQAAATAAGAEVQRASQQRDAALALDPADPVAVDEATTALGAATQRLADANRAVPQAQADLDTANRAVPQAQADLDTANRALAQVAPSNDEAVRQAAATLATAQAERRALDAPRDVGAARVQVASAERTLAIATDDRDRFQAENGTTVPAGEIIFVPSLPLRVEEAKFKVGDTASGTVLTLSSTTLAVDSSIATADRGIVSVGSTVEVVAADFDIETEGTISFLDTKPGTNGVDAQRVSMTITLNDPELAEELAGASVRITIPVASTEGEVLTVPVSAIVTDPSGSTSVTVLRDGKQTEVAVRTGLASGGNVEITPIDGTLAEGDRVIVDEAAVPPPETETETPDVSETPDTTDTPDTPDVTEVPTGTAAP